MCQALPEGPLASCLSDRLSDIAGGKHDAVLALEISHSQ